MVGFAHEPQSGRKGRQAPRHCAAADAGDAEGQQGPGKRRQAKEACRRDQGEETLSAQIDIEPIPPWLSAWLADLDVLGATEGAIDGGPDHVRRLLLHIVRDFPLDIFKSVTLPTASLNAVHFMR